MLNSRDTSLLEEHVETNCLIFKQMCKDEGYDVLITGTVRDNEYQRWCYNKGYSSTAIPSFHSIKAGLAFDVCKNVKGHEYDDENFWKGVSKIGKMIGFTWGGDWKKFTDKPHFQWDNHGKISGTMVRNGLRPPPMPIYDQYIEDELEMIIDQIAVKSGKSKEQVIDALAVLVRFANTTTESYENTGVKYLKDKGFISSDHDPREMVEYGELGLILQRMK